MKTSLTVVDLYASAREIGGLVGKRVENIYTSPQGYLFKFSGGIYVIINEARISITGFVGQRDFKGAETLRGLIRDSKLIEARVPRFDKVLILRFDEVELVAELVKPFNLIAVRGGEVVWLDHYYRGKDREVKVGAAYTPPPMPYVDPLADADRALGVLKAAADIKKALIKELGLGPEVAEEVYARGGGDPEGALEALRSLIREVREGRLAPAVYFAAGEPLTVTPVEYISVKYEEREDFDAFWKALDKYFIELELKRAIGARTEGIRAEKAKLKQSVAKLRAEADEYRRRNEELRLLAKLLLDHKYELEEALGLLRRGETPQSIRILYVDKKRREAEIELSGARARLSYEKPIGKQIEALFEEARELSRKAQRAEEAIVKLEGELSKLEEAQRAAEREVEESVRRAAAKAWFEKYRWTTTSGRTPAIGGRDASQNEALVRKHLRDDHFFIHADIPGAAVVVAKPTEDPLELLELAQFAASYSRGWKAGIHSLDVFYVPGRQVSKQPPSGEYLARGSFMVYGAKNYVRHVRLELAVGVRDDEGVKRIVVAPPRSITLLAQRYAVLAPGNLDKNKVAKELAKRWQLPSYMLDELVAALPGPSSIGYYGKGDPLPWDQIKAIFAEW